MALEVTGPSAFDGQMLCSLGEFPGVYNAGGEVDGCGIRLQEWGVGGVG